MMFLRFALGCLLLAASGIPLSLDTAAFHRWYGEPIMERFTARPGINVTVEYGSDGLACEVRISPASSLVEEEQLQAALRAKNGERVVFPEATFRRMSSPVVDELIEQVAPASMRGKAFGSLPSQASCAAIETDDYENVKISRGIALCESKEKADCGVSISFKRDICTKPETQSMKK